MDFLEYINSHRICAINKVHDHEKLLMLVRMYPDRFRGSEAYYFLRDMGCSTNMRFEDGKFASYLSHLYDVGDFFNCEAVVDFDDIVIVDPDSESNPDISALI